MTALLKLDWQDWLYSLGQACIGGGAGSVIAAVSAGLIAPNVFNFTNGIKSTLYLFVSCFVVNAFFNLMNFLKTSPLPRKEEPVAIPASNTSAPAAPSK